MERGRRKCVCSVTTISTKIVTRAFNFLQSCG